MEVIMDYQTKLRLRYEWIKDSLPCEAKELIEELLTDYEDSMEIILTLNDALEQACSELSAVKKASTK